MYRGAQKSVKLYKEVKFFLWIKKMVYCYLISINAVFAQLISWKINLLERFKKVKFIAYLYFTVHIFERYITCNLQCNRRSTTCVREIWLEKIYTMLLCLKTFWWMVKKKWLDTYIVKTLWFFFLMHKWPVSYIFFGNMENWSRLFWHISCISSYIEYLKYINVKRNDTLLDVF